MFQSHNGSIFLSFPRALWGTGALPKHHSPSVGGVAIRTFHQHHPPFSRSDLVKSTQSFISSKWGLSEGRIQNGGAKLAFITDPSPNAPAPGSGSNTSSLNKAYAPVLQIQYLAVSRTIMSVVRSSTPCGTRAGARFRACYSRTRSRLILDPTGSRAGSCLAWGGPDLNNW